MYRLACKIALIATTLCLLAVSTAFADTHYASPTGVELDDTGCTQLDPCSLSEAVNSPLWAATGDEVVLLPGTYTVSTQLVITKGLNVHGTGMPGETLLSSNLTLPIEINHAAATLSRVKISSTNSNNISGINLTNGTVQNSFVDSQAGIAINVLLGKITDTIAIAHGSNGSLGYHGAGIASSYPTGGLTANLILRNVTSVGKGASYSDGLFIRSDGGGGQATVNARSSIFVGGPNANSYDVFASQVGSVSNANLVLSNYSTVGQLGGGTITTPGHVGSGDQTAEPTFVDPDDDDYHLSPTSAGAINLGGNPPDDLDIHTGLYDIDGGPRKQGIRTEIGADEIDAEAPAPPVITSPSSGAFVNYTFKVSGTSEPDSQVYVGDGFESLCEAHTDNAGAFSCTVPPSVVLSNGVHTLRANATDAALNISNISADVLITVDTVAPKLVITSPVSSSTVAAAPAAAFTLVEANPGVTECRLDQGAFAPCGQGTPLGDLTDRIHFFAVRHTDAAGNQGQETAVFTTDGSGPLLDKDSFSNKKGKAKVKFSSNEPGTFTCKLDKGKAKPCKSPYKTKKLKKGKHKLAIVGTDALGNVGKPLKFSWKVKK